MLELVNLDAPKEFFLVRSNGVEWAFLWMHFIHMGWRTRPDDREEEIRILMSSREIIIEGDFLALLFHPFTKRTVARISRDAEPYPTAPALLIRTITVRDLD